MLKAGFFMKPAREDNGADPFIPIEACYRSDGNKKTRVVHSTAGFIVFCS